MARRGYRQKPSLKVGFTHVEAALVIRGLGMGVVDMVHRSSVERRTM